MNRPLVPDCCDGCVDNYGRCLIHDSCDGCDLSPADHTQVFGFFFLQSKIKSGFASLIRKSKAINITIEPPPLDSHLWGVHYASQSHHKDSGVDAFMLTRSPKTYSVILEKARIHLLLNLGLIIQCLIWKFSTKQGGLLSHCKYSHISGFQQIPNASILQSAKYWASFLL